MNMLYPFITVPDDTEIAHSESMTVDGKERVKVCIERPVDYGYKTAVCWLPDYTRKDATGFTEAETASPQEIIESLAHTIIEPAGDGGFGHTAAVNNDFGILGTAAPFSS